MGEREKSERKVEEREGKGINNVNFIHIDSFSNDFNSNHNFICTDNLNCKLITISIMVTILSLSYFTCSMI